MNIGDKFGQLTVTELRGKSVVCACSCGATGIIRDARTLRMESQPSRRINNGEAKCRACAKNKRRKFGENRESLAKGKARANDRGVPTEP